MANEVPSLIRRSPHMIDLAIPREAGVDKYKILGHQTLNDAYGVANGVGGSGAIPILEAQAGDYFRSPTIRHMKPPPIVEESFRQQTRILFDIDDYNGPVNLLPSDTQPLFLRMQKFHLATGGYLPEGPILVVMAPGFFNTRLPSFTLTGSAPGIGCKPGEKHPPGAMHIVFTAAVGELTITNLNPSTSLYISFEKDMTTAEIAGATALDFQGEWGEILLSAPTVGTAIDFSILVRLVNAG